MPKATLTIDMPESMDTILDCPAWGICSKFHTSAIKACAEAGAYPPSNCPLQEVKTCKWVRSSCGDYMLGCNTYRAIPVTIYDDLFEYCPYCSNEIEVGGDNE